MWNEIIWMIDVNQSDEVTTVPVRRCVFGLKKSLRVLYRR